jgi:hypothetical protein
LDEPGWEAAASGRQRICGTVNDFNGSIRHLTCRLADREAEATLRRQGHLAQAFEAHVDTTGLADGVYELTIEPTNGMRPDAHRRPVIVRNGKVQPLKADPTASLRLRVSGTPGTQLTVQLNGRPVGRVQISGKKGDVVSLAVPQGLLVRLNEIRLEKTGGQEVEVSNVHLELDGETRRDIRYPPTKPHGLPEDAEGSAVFLIDVTYAGQRGR